EQIGSDPGDFGAHSVKHPAELLNVWLTCCVVDRGGALGQDSGHENIGRSRHGSFLQQHVASLQFRCGKTEKVFQGIVVKAGAQFLQTDKMRVQSSASDLVASRLGDPGLSEACQQGAHQHDGSAKGSAFALEFRRAQVIQIHRAGLECETSFAMPRDRYAEVFQQINQVVYVLNVRHVFNGHFFVCEQDRRNDLKGFIFSALWNDLSLKRCTPNDFK